MLTDETDSTASRHTPYVFTCRACKSAITSVTDTKNTHKNRRCVFVVDPDNKNKLYADCLSCGERHDVPNRPLYSRHRMSNARATFLSPSERLQDPALERRKLLCPLCKNVSMHVLYTMVDSSYDRAPGEDPSTTTNALASNLAKERFVVRAICSYPSCHHTHSI